MTTPTITLATADERSVSVTDTRNAATMPSAYRKAALQRQTCMDYAFCLFNFNCIGRCYGRRLLQSGTIRQDHPLHNDDHARKYLPMFNTMSLSIKSIETLYEVFQLIDADNSGEIDLDEFLFFFRLQSSRFAKRAFSCIDADGSGEIDFGEFVLGLYNFCTCDNLSLCRFAFDIYDEDASGMLDHDEILHIVKDLYGRKGFKRNPSAQKTIEQLQTMKWYCSQGGEIVTAGEKVDFNAFFQFSKNHPSMLYPAFRMQYDLQSKVLGKKRTTILYHPLFFCFIFFGQVTLLTFSFACPFFSSCARHCLLLFFFFSFFFFFFHNKEVDFGKWLLCKEKRSNYWWERTTI